MRTPESGFRRARAITGALVVVGVLGTAGGAIAAYTGTQSANAETPSHHDDDDSDHANTTPAPVLNTGGANTHARSEGS